MEIKFCALEKKEGKNNNNFKKTTHGELWPLEKDEEVAFKDLAMGHRAWAACRESCPCGAAMGSARLLGACSCSAGDGSTSLPARAPAAASPVCSGTWTLTSSLSIFLQFALSCLLSLICKMAL